MKMKFLALFAVLFVACFALHFVEPAVAASNNKGYLIDHGETKFYPAYKASWKTYWYSKNTRKVVQTFYIKEGGKWKKYDPAMTFVIQKVSKSKLKITQVNKNYGKASWVEKTKLSTKSYYWKVFRKKFLIDLGKTF